VSSWRRWNFCEYSFSAISEFTENQNINPAKKDQANGDEIVGLYNCGLYIRLTIGINNPGTPPAPGTREHFAD
jgi:hypothetical protein